MPTTSPSSSTTIWSAPAIVLIRWATTITAESRVHGRSAVRSRGVGGEVECRERVVEQVEVGSAHERSRDGEALTLTARHVRSSLCDLRLQPTGHRCDEVSSLGDGEGLPHLLVRGVGLAIAQVAGHRAAEQIRPLGHEADAGPQVVRVEVAHVDAVEQHGPARRRRRGERRGSRAWSCPNRCCRRWLSSCRLRT